MYRIIYILLGIVSQIDCTCDEPLGVSYNLKTIKDDQLSASSSESRHVEPALGRLHQPMQGKGFGVWCAAVEDRNPWFQISFNSMTAISKVAIGTNDQLWEAYVKTYSLKYSYDERIWYDVRTDDWSKPMIFQGMKTVYDISTVTIGRPVVAKYFRIYPLTKYDRFCLQTELYGCRNTTDCNHAVGIDNRSIVLDNQMSASSSIVGHNPSQGRLNNLLIQPPLNWGAWCAGNNDLKPWLQIDLKYVREVSKLSTQGHPSADMNAWVMEYRLNYSVNAINWFEYDQVFTGNINGNTRYVNNLNEPITARYIRFLPLAWNEMACLRVEVYECMSREEFTPKLLQPIQDIVINRGEEYQFLCTFEGQPGMKLGWNKNGKFLSTDDRINTEETISDRAITATLRFKRLKSEENQTMFTCLAWYPRLDKTYSSSSAIISVNAPVATADILTIESRSVELKIGFSGPQTKDMIGYKLRIQSNNATVLRTLNFVNQTILNLTSLHPYRRYNIEAAVLYIGNEIGPFDTRQSFVTIQDVPSSAPLDLRISKVAHDSLVCTWNLPRDDDRNGVITSYQVRYLRSVTQDEEPVKKERPKSKFLTVNHTGITLSKLDAGSVYEIAVRAYTIIGPGPFSHPPIIKFTGKATEELTSLNQMVITEGNAVAVGNRLKNITADPNFLNKHDVVLTIDILEKVVEAQNSSEMLGQSLVAAISNVLKANKTVLDESEITNRTGTRYVQMLEKWLENVKPEEKKLEENSENIIVKKIFLQKHKIEEGIKFAEGDGIEIVIPKEALPKNDSGDSIYFVYYKTNKFFTKKEKIEELCEGGFTVTKERTFTPVISGDIVGQEVKNLSAPVILRFKANQKVNLKESACVYWDFKANNGKGDWSRDGCELQSVVNQTITCHCNHLTNFAAMMDVYAQTSKICGFHQQVLTYISVIGCFMSLIGLFFTFLTYLLFRRLLKEMSAKVLIQLCAALFIVIVAFVTGIEQTNRPQLCTAVSVILHYFTLVSFMWMLMEAAFMYHAFVRVWPPREGGDIVKSTVIAWGVPFFIVLITFLTNSDKYRGQHYCHLHGLPLYIGYLAPIGLIICINFVLFVCIMHRLSTRPNSNTDQSNTEIAFTRLRRAFGIMILMGLTWSFGFGSASSARLEFTYLFAICNGLQGFAIFVFYCFAQKNARMAWYRFFTCDTRSERKITTDSYYERSRLSSNISNRTNTLQFRRLGSNASSVLQSPQSIPYNNSEGSLLNTIEEIDSPIQAYESEIQAVSTDQQLSERDTLISIEDIYQDSEENLNMRLEREEHRKSKSDLKQYSSYRALSNTTPNGGLSTSLSAKNLIKDLIQVKSAEHLNNNKITGNNIKTNNRKSMIETSYQQTNNADYHNVKLCVSNTESHDIPPLAQDKTIDLLSYKSVHSTEHIDSGVAIETSSEPKSNSSKERTGTMKSDASTMTNESKLIGSPVHPPSYNADTDHSGPNIRNWLDSCDDPSNNDVIKDTDSDYSSSCYKTSPSSSIADLNFSTQNFSESPAPKKRNKQENTLPVSLKECTPADRNHNKVTRQSSTSFNTDSEKSENGYSASEEDGKNNQHNKQKNKLKKRKHQKPISPRSSTVNLLKHSNAYVTLDAPSDQVSYV